MIRFIVAGLVLISVSACWHRPTYTVPTPKHDIVVLLPDPETQTVGRALVSSSRGASTELSAEGTATQIGVGEAPTAPFTMDDSTVQKMFGEAMSARPPAPRQFLLYFFFDSAQLTPESETLLRRVLDVVKNRPAPDVTVIGHTDTIGTAQWNIALGHSRAVTIRDQLVTIGLNGSLVTVASHGEADPLVRTPDETPEPRNRRVEVSVR